VKIWNFTPLLLAVFVSGCSGDRDARLPASMQAELSAPDPILATDRVADARTAIHLGVARCFPGEPEASFQAELQKDQWFVWADFKSASRSADVGKNDGSVTDCRDIEV